MSCVSESSCFESLHALDLIFWRTRRTPSPRESRNCACPRTKLSCMMSNMINRCLEVTCPQGANCYVLVFTLCAASIVCAPRPYTRLSTVHTHLYRTHSTRLCMRLFIRVCGMLLRAMHPRRLIVVCLGLHAVLRGGPW